MLYQRTINRVKRRISDILSGSSCLQPNFLIPGAARSGSTALYHYLKQHPEIYFARVKEPNFFSLYYDLGEKWYLSHFKSLKNYPAIGEASTSYMISDIAPKRIYNFNPNFKLIFILRDPTERTYSLYKRTIQFLGENRSFEDIIKHPNNGLIQGSKYFTNIKRFLEYFSKENMFFLIFEKFIEENDKYLKEICQFLEINSKFKFNSNSVFQNPSIMPFSFTLQKINKKYFVPKPHERTLKKSIKFGIYRTIVNLNCLSKSRKFSELKEKTRLHLKKYFQEEISNLEKLIDVDLNIWKSV